MVLSGVFNQTKARIFDLICEESPLLAVPPEARDASHG